MVVGASVNDFLQILSDLAVTVTYYQATNTQDTMYGQGTPTYGAGVSKTWIFFKRGSKIDLAKFGIVDNGDAYVLFPTSDSLYYGDRVAINGETFEYTPDCFNSDRYANGVHMFRYCTLKLVAK